MEYYCRHRPENWLDPIPLTDLFPGASTMEVDLGCGKGRFLLARARRHPEIPILGIDRMLTRIRKIDNRARRMKLTNLRLLRIEGAYAVSYLLPPESVSTYYIFFPDPWPKKRHHGNRMFSDLFLQALVRTLAPGGCLHVATDHRPYFEEIRGLLEGCSALTGIQPYIPDEEERTDFERWYHGKTEIGRCSFKKG